MTNAPDLPIRSLTLYKHGVAWVERNGALSGEEVQIAFRADEVNDALKSLLVLDRRGGHVLGIHYTTPVDGDVRLDESPIKLGTDHSLLDLLRSIRGVMVRLVSGTGTEREDIVGRLLGVDVATPDQPQRQPAVSVLDQERGTVITAPLRTLRQVEIRDTRARDDLGFVLDWSRAEEAHRTIVVRLSPGDHDLYLSYLVPSPTWRVAYRLVAEARTATANAKDTADGTLLIQGWGLFDNRMEEDLVDVRVTLVAGQPISFAYDLATSRIPERPVVEDAARIAPGPVEFEAMYAAMPMPAPAMGLARPLMDAMPARQQAKRERYAVADLAQQPVAASGGDAGELFQYEVLAPVTVRRGESALVPILSAQLPYHRELLFNEEKLPDHPVAAFRFTNGTGLVLERGPVTVLEDGGYRGEAMVPFTRADGDIYLAFAVELGIKITVQRDTRQEATALRIVGALLELRQATITQTTYRLESTLAQAQTVTVEHPLRDTAELVDMAEPVGRTAEFMRWEVACPPHDVTTFTVSERYYTWESSELLDWDYAQLQEFLTRRWLDKATLGRIRTLLDLRATITRNSEEIRKIGVERDRLYKRQEQLRANMGALGTSGEEGTLRRSLVAQLQTSETRLNRIDERTTALQTENEQHEAAIEAELESFSVKETQK